MYRKFLLCSLFLSLPLCALANKPFKKANDHACAFSKNATGFNGQPIASLGGGYSQDMQSPENLSCLNPGKISFDGPTKAIINIGDSKDFSEIENQLKVDVSASGSIGLFSADASASYARHIKEDHYSESFYYFEQVQLPTKIFLPTAFKEDALNDIGHMAYAAGEEQFRWTCGDQFFQQELLGATLFVTLKLNFHRLSDKMNFDTHVGGSLGQFISAGADLQKLVNQYHIQGDLEMSAYQLGGNPLHLSNIFTKSQGEYYITKCAFNNLDACKQVIGGVINYAQTDFSNQIDFRDGTIYGVAAPLDYATMDYSKLGLSVGDSILTKPILDARLKLGDLYKSTLKKWKFVSHILNSPSASHIVKTYKDRLQSVQSHLAENLSLLEDTSHGAVGCYLHPDRCVVIAKNIEDELTPIDEDIIYQFQLGYSIYVAVGQNYQLYYDIPLGGNQYYSVVEDTFEPTAYHVQLDIIDGGNTLKLDITDIAGNHITGRLSKISEGVFQGNQMYPDGAHLTTFTQIQNPV